MSKYVLELIDRDGVFIEHLCRRHSEREYNPTTTTMNAFKAEVFTEADLENIGWFQKEAMSDFGTIIKVVRIL